MARSLLSEVVVNSLYMWLFSFDQTICDGISFVLRSPKKCSVDEEEQLESAIVPHGLLTPE